MFKTFTTYICILTFFFPLLLTSQSRVINFINHSSSDGLINDNVSCFAQDSFGYIWIGTDIGLSRYDGTSFYNYSSHDTVRTTMLSGNIQCLYVDKNNNIWVGTQGGGLSIYDRVSDQFTNYLGNDSLFMFENITAICPYGDDVWLATERGVFICSYFDDKAFQCKSLSDYYNTTLSLKDNQLRSLFLDDGKRMFIGTELGYLYCFDLVQKKLHDLSIYAFEGNGMPEGAIMDIEKDGNDTVWLATWGNGLMKFYGNVQTVEELENSISKMSVLETETSNIFTDLAIKEDKLYAATWGDGLALISWKNSSVELWKNGEAKNPGLRSNSVAAVYVDADNNIWLGTSRFGGASMYNWKSSIAEQYSIQSVDFSAIDRNRLYATAYDKKNTIFAGGIGGVVALNTVTKQLVDLTELHRFFEKNSLKILSLYLDQSTNNLWIGTDGKGVVKYSVNNNDVEVFKRIKGKNSLSNNAVHDVFVDSEGNLWCGSWGGGLDRYSIHDNTFYNYIIDSNRVTANVVLDIAEASDSTLWIAAHGKGILLFNKNSNQFTDPVFVNEELINKHFYYVKVDDKGRLWASCHENGLLMYDKEMLNMHWFNHKNGFVFNHISGVEQGSDGTIYINTNNGVFTLSEQLQKKEHFRFSDDLGDLIFWHESSVMTNDEMVYLASDKGLVSYNLGGLVTDSALYTPVIVGGAVDDVDINNSKQFLKFEDDSLIENITSITLPYSKNSIELEFASMQFKQSQENKYAYILEGVHKRWHENEFYNNKVSLSNIPSGTHLFKVKASNSDGVWNEIPRLVKITIIPPFWEQWWFITISIIFISIAIALFIRWRFSKLKAHNLKLEKIVEDRTLEIKERNYELSSSNKALEEKTLMLEVMNEKVNAQKEAIEEHHKQIKDSIVYAKRIQDAMLPSRSVLSSNFKESYIYYRPRDVVSGDFYWIHPFRDKIVVVAADCTGHGVPGAFMSVLGISLFNTASKTDDDFNAGELLSEVSSSLYKALHNNELINSQDSMDLSLCIFDRKQRIVHFSGAFNPLYIFRSGELRIISADKLPVGSSEKEGAFENTTISLEVNDRLYMFSDGYPDQFGGLKGKKFKIKNFRNLLFDVQRYEMHKQEEILHNAFEEWLEYPSKLNLNEQTDDVLVIGIQIDDDFFL